MSGTPGNEGRTVEINGANRKKILLILLPVLGALVVAGIVLGIVKSGNNLTAIAMRLQRMVGTVSLFDAGGKEKSIQEQMRLTSGESINTAKDSLVMVSLDETKLITMEENSEGQIIKDGNALRFDLKDGNLYFNVTEKLADAQSFDIETSTLICGIRGTSGFDGKDADGHEVLMVTDGNVHVKAVNPATGEEMEVDVPPAHMITVYLDGEADGDSTLSVETQPFREEDLPPLVLDSIAKNKELADRVTGATGFSQEKLLALAEIMSTDGVSMVGEAAQLLTEAGVSDAIPLMGSSAVEMGKVANAAVEAAGEDLPLEIAMIRGLRSVLDVGVENGYEGEDLSDFMEGATECLTASCQDLRDSGTEGEDLLMVVEAVSDAIRTSSGDMASAGLSGGEIRQVLASSADVYTTTVREALADNRSQADLVTALVEQSETLREGGNPGRSADVTAMAETAEPAAEDAPAQGRDNAADVREEGAGAAQGRAAQQNGTTNGAVNGAASPAANQQIQELWQAILSQQQAEMTAQQQAAAEQAWLEEHGMIQQPAAPAPAPAADTTADATPEEKSSGGSSGGGGGGPSFIPPQTNVNMKWQEGILYVGSATWTENGWNSSVQMKEISGLVDGEMYTFYVFHVGGGIVVMSDRGDNTYSGGADGVEIETDYSGSIRTIINNGRPVYPAP